MNTPLEQLLANLQSDEHVVAEAALCRLDQGQTVYGPWRVDDGRDYPKEAFAEVIDALHYCAAELVRLRRARPRTEGRHLRVYVCHPFGGDPEGNARKVRIICRALVEGGHLPIAPHLYLPAFVDERDERDLAIASASSWSRSATSCGSTAVWSPAGCAGRSTAPRRWASPSAS